MLSRWQHQKMGQNLMSLLLEEAMKQGKENFRREILVIMVIKKLRCIKTWERTLHLYY